MPVYGRLMVFRMVSPELPVPELPELKEIGIQVSMRLRFLYLKVPSHHFYNGSHIRNTHTRDIEFCSFRDHV